jgi:hypothetical protein
VFDPARDEEPTNAHWWHRLVAVGVLTLLVALTLGPTLTPYRVSTTESSSATTCLPLRDGWAAGPCAAVSHHRITLSLVLLGVLAVLILFAIALVHFRTTRTNLRRSPTAAVGQ